MVWKRNRPHANNMVGVCGSDKKEVFVMSWIHFLKTHGSNLTEESLQTLVVEVKVKVCCNCQLKTTYSRGNDATSLAALSPINLLTMKSRVVMPSPGNFTTPDRYSRKQWRRVQHVANKFWDRWRKEALLALQNREKWNNQKWKLSGWDIALLRQETDRNQKPMARIVNAYSDGKGNVHSVRLLLSASDKSDNSTRNIWKDQWINLLC